MDRSVFLIALLAITGNVAIAQDAPKTEPSPALEAAAVPTPSPNASPQNRDARVPERIRQRMEKLPEEERAKFLENFRQWQQMSEEEKAHFRDRAVREKQKIHNAVDEAIKKTGLVLEPEKREVFALRYMQERKKIEQELWTEMRTKRDKMLEEVLEKLKAEFGSASKSQEGNTETPAAVDTAPKASPTP